VAQRAKHNDANRHYGASEPFGTAAGSARRQLRWLLSRESLLRLMLSLVLATALWLYITGKQASPTTYDYPGLLPVTYHGLNGSYVVNEQSEDVRLRVQVSSGGPYFNAASFQPFVDLAGKRPGFYRIPVQVQRDPGVKVVQIIPRFIPVRIEALKAVAVPVGYKLVNKPPPGYREDVTMQPTTVRISGPASLVAQVHQAQVSLSATRFNFSGQYSPLPVNSQGQQVIGHFAQTSPDPPAVQVTVRVIAPATFKTLPVIPPLRGQPKVGFGVVGLKVQPSEITVEGPADKLSRLTSIGTQPVSLSKRAGTFLQRVRLRLPRGVLSSTTSVKVTPQLATVDTSTSVRLGVTPENVEGSLLTSINPATVIVTVVGPSSSVREIAHTLHATLKLFGYGPGTYSLKPQIFATSRYQVTGFYPSTVTVAITTH